MNKPSPSVLWCRAVWLVLLFCLPLAVSADDSAGSASSEGSPPATGKEAELARQLQDTQDELGAMGRRLSEAQKELRVLRDRDEARDGEAAKLTKLLRESERQLDAVRQAYRKVLEGSQRNEKEQQAIIDELEDRLSKAGGPDAPKPVPTEPPAVSLEQWQASQAEQQRLTDALQAARDQLARLSQSPAPTQGDPASVDELSRTREELKVLRRLYAQAESAGQAREEALSARIAELEQTPSATRTNPVPAEVSATPEPERLVPPNESAEHARRVEDLEQRLAGLQQELESARAQAARATQGSEELGRAREELRVLQHLYGQLEQKSARQEQSLQEKVRELERASSTTTNEVQTLQAVLRQERESHAQALKTARDEREDLAARLKDLTAEGDRIREEAGSLRKQLAKVEEAAVKAGEIDHRRMEELTQTREELRTLRNLYAKLETASRERQVDSERRLADQAKNLARSTNSVAHLDGQLRELQQANQDLRAALKEQQAANRTQLGELESLRKECRIAGEEIAKYRAASESHEADARKQAEELKTALAQMSAFEKANAQWQTWSEAETRNWTQKTEALKTELSALREAEGQLQAKLKEAHANQGQAGEQALAREKELAARVEALQQEVNTIRSTLQQANSELETCKQNYLEYVRSTRSFIEQIKPATP